MIARVFPRRTAMSPRDSLAFFKEPTIENIADCIKARVTEVHISVTFTWDIPRAEDLYYAWQILGVPVEVGGPAFDDRMGDFVPGLYLRDGLVFTSLRLNEGLLVLLRAALRTRNSSRTADHGRLEHPRRQHTGHQRAALQGCLRDAEAAETSGGVFRGT